MWLTKRLHVSIKWFDLWVGIYYDRDARIVYICPIPTVCFMYVQKPMPYEFKAVYLWKDWWEGWG